MDVNGLRSQHVKLKEMSYEPKELYRGYSDRILYINLDDSLLGIHGRREKYQSY